MQVRPITKSAYTGLKAVKISPKYKKNIGRQFIYNEVLDVARKLEVPATFHTNKIELPEPTFALLARLKELGIAFRKVK